MARIKEGILVVGLMLFLLGCGPKLPEGVNMEMGMGGDSYATTVGLSPKADLAKEIDQWLRPALEEVFGGAKLKLEATMEKSVVLNYILKTPLTQEKLGPLSEKVEAAGYPKGMDLVFDDGFVLQFTDGINQLALEGSFDDNMISVAIVPVE